MNNDILIWIHDNKLGISELINPLIKQKNEALKTYDPVFHDEIIKQFESLYLSLIGIEVSMSLGCSAEDFYDTIQEDNVSKYLTAIIQEGESND